MRLWRTSKEAGRPFPVLDDDDVIDFMITEAVAARIYKEEHEGRKEEKVKAWKKDKAGLDRLREIAGG